MALDLGQAAVAAGSVVLAVKLGRWQYLMASGSSSWGRYELQLGKLQLGQVASRSWQLQSGQVAVAEVGAGGSRCSWGRWQKLELRRGSSCSWGRLQELQLRQVAVVAVAGRCQ